MKFLLSLLMTFILLSCSPFSGIAKLSLVSTDINRQTQVTNTAAKFKSLTYGDFQFATNKKEFKLLNQQKAKFDNILIYAKTEQPKYEYYILYNPKSINLNDDYKYKDTIIENSRFVLAISKIAPPTDAKFISGRMSSLAE